MAIRPYPYELEEYFTLKDGRAVQLRPIRPEDEPEHQDFFTKLSAEDVQLRFFVALGEILHPAMARLT